MSNDDKVLPASLPVVFRLVQFFSVLAIISSLLCMTDGFSISAAVNIIFSGYLFYGVYKRINFTRIVIVGFFASNFVFFTFSWAKIFWQIKTTGFSLALFVLMILTVALGFLFFKFFKDCKSQKAREAFGAGDTESIKEDEPKEKISIILFMLLGLICFIVKLYK